jgi:aspartyl-tRNA(Asn)/glutamyl-tRNA(Gln) amidotransferase subunit A
MTTANSPHELTAIELLDAFRGNQLSPVEALEDLLSHVELWEPQLNALFAFDPDGVRSAAEASTERWTKGEPLGPFDGVPYKLFSLRGEVSCS